MKHATLSKTLAALNSIEDIDAFLKDLCTPAELKAIHERWKICQILHHEPELSYQAIHDRTEVSINTIGRVARYLRQEPNGGYLAALQASSDT